MALFLGGVAVTDLNIGGVAVSEAYLGSTLVWKRAYAPIVITQPVAFSGANGATATYTCAFDADPVATYQWYDNLNAPVAGATTTTLSFVVDYLAHNGKSYYCRATNSEGFTDTVLAACTVALPAPPVVVTNPVGATIVEGTTHTMTAAFSGFYGTPTYQWWQYNGSTWHAIPGANNPASYTYTGVLNDPLGLSFMCRCTDQVGQYTDTAFATMVVTSASLSVHNMTVGLWSFSGVDSTGWQDGLYGSIDTNAVDWMEAGALLWYISHSSSTGNLGLARVNGNLIRESFTNMNITGPSGSFDYPSATASQPFADRLEWPGLPFANGQAVVVTFT